VVPAFLAALEEAGAEAVRANAYVTRPGAEAGDSVAERQLLEGGWIDAIAFSSTAEVKGPYFFCIWPMREARARVCVCV
jgi:uroporphyrinogen-III synthase